MIRHAPVIPDGCLAGRRDVAADCSDAPAFADLARGVGPIDRLVVSPARRCVETASALWPQGVRMQVDGRLWEQNFGDWEGMTFAAVPDLGPMAASELIDVRAPGGESFSGLCQRCRPALEALAQHGGRIAVVAHAGTVRAALALALGSAAAGMAFQIAPLSLTHLTARGGCWSIATVNWTPRRGPQSTEAV